MARWVPASLVPLELPVDPEDQLGLEVLVLLEVPQVLVLLVPLEYLVDQQALEVPWVPADLVLPADPQLQVLLALLEYLVAQRVLEVQVLPVALEPLLLQECSQLSLKDTTPDVSFLDQRLQ